jgi:hypothetical protein
MAGSFTALSDYRLDRIEVPLGLMPFVPDPPIIRATVYTAGSVFPWPETVLETVLIDFRVTGTEVPEPATAALAAFALLLICSHLKPRTSGSASPAPSSDLRV